MRLLETLEKIRAQNAYNSIIAQNSQKSKRKQGFTIVELLIVVVVIAILATITIVAYNGITAQAKDATLKADLANGAKQLHIAKVEDGNFPNSNPGLPSSDGTTLTYSGGGNEFCLQATNGTSTFYTTHGGAVQEGECPPRPVATGDFIQTVTKDRCPEERIVVRDARDNHSYFIQKMADGQCWMLTNLAYAGGTSNGGSNIYSDTISTATLTNGTGEPYTYTEPKYYIHTNANPTIHPATPSTSIDGGATNPQYGYHYNWCAAMGAQTGASACAIATTPAPDPTISICPAGWRLPTGEPTTGEFTTLAAAIGATNDAAGSAILRSVWLAQYAGYWNASFGAQGSLVRYWSATQQVNHTASARILSLSISSVSPSPTSGKNYGLPVRCTAV